MSGRRTEVNKHQIRWSLTKTHKDLSTRYWLLERACEPDQVPARPGDQVCQLKTDSQLPRSSTCRTPESEPDPSTPSRAAYDKIIDAARTTPRPFAYRVNKAGNLIRLY